jgi:HK97 family phage portal protein
MSVLRRLLASVEIRAIGRVGGFVPFDRVPPVGDHTDVHQALNLNAYLSGIRLLADTVSTLPVDAYIRQDGVRRAYRPKPNWLTAPDPRNPTQTMQSVISQAIISLYSDGNAFIATLRDDSGEVQELHVLDPKRVTIRRGADGAPVYVIRHANNATVEAGPDEIKHVPLIRLAGEERGIDLLRASAGALNTGLAIEEFAANYFSNGASPSGVVTVPSEMKADVAASLRDQLARAQTGGKRWSLMMLTGGADFKEYKGIDPEQTQLLSSRTFTVLQVCRLLRIPPMMLAVTEGNAMSYSSVEQQSLAFVRDTVRPLAGIIESALSPLITNPQAFVRFSLEGLLRGASADRAAYYTQLLGNGGLSVNDVRALEDQRPVDGGDSYRMPLNEAPNFALAETKAKADVLASLVSSGVALDEARRIVGV